MNWNRLSIVGCIGLLVIVQNSFGLGIRQPEQGAAAIAQNDAFVAQADDPSAVYYNPAGLAQIKGTESMWGAYINGPEASYEGKGPAAGNSKGTQDQISVTPHFYAVSDFGTEWFRGGIGLFTPFGQAIDWGNNNSFRYVTTRSALRMVDVNPTVAFKICDQLSLGIGYDFYYAEAELRQAFPFVVPGPFFAGEGNFRFDGQGEGHGYNVGVLWKPFEQHHFGINYRSSFDIEFDGHTKLSNIPAGLGLPSKLKSHAHAEFNFPDVLQLGYAFWPTPKWKLELDGDWTHWDVTNDQALKSRKLRTTLGLPQSQLKTKLNWEDSWIVELGTQYEVKDGIFVRGGFYFSENSVPEKNFIPSVADNDRVGVSTGLGFKCKNITVDLAYQFNITLDRTVKNNVGNSPFPPASQSVNGEYESYSQGGAVSVAYHF